MVFTNYHERPNPVIEPDRNARSIRPLSPQEFATRASVAEVITKSAITLPRDVSIHGQHFVLLTRQPIHSQVRDVSSSSFSTPTIMIDYFHVAVDVVVQYICLVRHGSVLGRWHGFRFGILSAFMICFYLYGVSSHANARLLWLWVVYLDTPKQPTPCNPLFTYPSLVVCSVSKIHDSIVANSQ